MAFSPSDSSSFILTRLGVLREPALTLFSSVEKLGEQEDRRQRTFVTTRNYLGNCLEPRIGNALSAMGAHTRVDVLHDRGGPVSALTSRGNLRNGARGFNAPAGPRADCCGPCIRPAFRACRRHLTVVFCNVAENV